MVHISNNSRNYGKSLDTEEIRKSINGRMGAYAGIERNGPDNMSLAMMREAVSIAAGKVLLEASGNMALAGERSVRAVAETGVDLISVGALTNSVEAMDISLRFL